MCAASASRASVASSAGDAALRRAAKRAASRNAPVPTGPSSRAGISRLTAAPAVVSEPAAAPIASARSVSCGGGT